MKHTFSIFLLAAALCGFQLSLLTACGGCSARKADKKEQAAEQTAVQATVSESQQEADAHAVVIRPKESTLSREAEITASYLTLYEALSYNRDEESALAAAEVLAKDTGEGRMPADDWIACSMCFLEAKSVNAVPFLKLACTAWPDDPQLAMLYSEALADNTFIKEGIAYLNDFLARNPDKPRIIQQLGELLQKDNRPAEAVTILSAIKEKDRTQSSDLCLAQALMDSGNDKDALPVLKNILKKDPDMDEALAVEAFLFEKTGDYAAACRAYEKLQKKFTDNPEIYVRLIVNYLKLNNPTMALKWHQEGPKEDVHFHMTAASCFLQAKHYLQAERILKSVLAMKDAPDEAYLYLAGIAAMQRKDFNEALGLLGKVSDKSDAAGQKYLLQAEYLCNLGKYTEALASVHKITPAPETALLESRILMLSQKTDDAAACLKVAIQKWQDNASLRFALANLLAGAGSMKEAVDCMESVIKLDPANYQALNFVGFTLANENRDIPRALELLKKANELAPGQFYILDSLAWAHFRAGNLDEALKLIREAARLDTERDPEVCEHYGDITLAKGLKEEARRAYRRAIDSYKKNPDRDKDKSKQEALRKKLEAL